MTDLQFILQERAAQLANPGSAGQIRELPSHVLVATGDQRFAVRLDLLLAGNRQTITPVPLSALEWVGVTHYLGEFWPVRWLGTPANWVCNRGFVLFLRCRRLGLLVEEHLGLSAVPAPSEGTPALALAGIDCLQIAHTLPDGTSVLEAL